MSSRIDAFLQACKVPGVAASAVNCDGTLYEGAAGVASTESGEPVSVTTPHAIYSMTKPVTSFAIMQLVEQGKLSLTDDVRSYLPDFAPDVISSFDADARTWETEPLARPITVHDLLTNTSGIGYPFCNATLGALLPDSGKPGFPICHQPGAAWTYGPSTAFLGGVIEAITGQTLEAALTDLVLAPLEMNDTSYEPRSNQARPHRLVDGSWQAQDLAGRMESGDAGLISTAVDYGKFVRCLLNDGAPLLKAETFKLMISNQIGDLFVTRQPSMVPAFALPFPTGDGVDKFGYGFQLHMAPAAGMRSPGSFSWCGVANTYFWCDPVKRVGGVVLMQLMPLYEPACLDTVSGFEKHLYETL